MVEGSAFRFEVQRSGDVFVGRLAGELDLATGRDLRERMLELCLSGRSIVLDLANVTFADSTALGIMVAAHKQLARQDRSLVLANLQPGIRTLFAMTALDRFIPICESRQEALAVAEGGTQTPAES